jgi:hypothetical protein
VKAQAAWSYKMLASYCITTWHHDPKDHKKGKTLFSNWNFEIKL